MVSISTTIVTALVASAHVVVLVVKGQQYFHTAGAVQEDGSCDSDDAPEVDDRRASSWLREELSATQAALKRMEDLVYKSGTFSMTMAAAYEKAVGPVVSPGDPPPSRTAAPTTTRRSRSRRRC